MSLYENATRLSMKSDRNGNIDFEGVMNDGAREDGTLYNGIKYIFGCGYHHQWIGTPYTIPQTLCFTQTNSICH